MKKILRMPEVIARTGLSRSSIYLYISRKEFPAQKLISDRAVGWLESDIENWIKTKFDPDSVS